MIRFLSGFLFLMLCGVAAWAGPLNDPLDEDAVRGALIERLEATGAFTRVEALSDGMVDLEWGSDGSAYTYLGNLLRDMAHVGPEERDAKLETLWKAR